MLDESTLQGMARIANSGEPISMEDVGRMVQIVEWLRICGYKVVKREPTPEMMDAGTLAAWRNEEGGRAFYPHACHVAMRDAA